MHQNRYAAVLLTAALAQAVAAQVTLSENDNIPVIGRMDDVVTGASYTPAPAGGPAVSHDFSAMVGGGTRTYQWLDPSTLPNASLFPGATLALTDGGTDTVYYSADASGLERVGEHEMLLSAYTVDAPYSDGVLELKFPLAYGDTWTDPISATFMVDAATAVRSGSITGNADAQGTILLPGSSTPVEIIRVRTYVNETITISSPPLSIIHHRHVDAYYAAYSKYPVFRSFSDTLNAGIISQNTQGTEWLASTSLGVAAVPAANTGVQLAPNPADDVVELSWTGNGSSTQLEVFDATGAVVLKRDLGLRTAGVQRTRIDAGAWTPGLYLVRLHDGASTVVKRLTVR